MLCILRPKEAFPARSSAWQEFLDKPRANVSFSFFRNSSFVSLCRRSKMLVARMARISFLVKCFFFISCTDTSRDCTESFVACLPLVCQPLSHQPSIQALDHNVCCSLAHPRGQTRRPLVRPIRIREQRYAAMRGCAAGKLGFAARTWFPLGLGQCWGRWIRWKGGLLASRRALQGELRNPRFSKTYILGPDSFLASWCWVTGCVSFQRCAVHQQSRITTCSRPVRCHSSVKKAEELLCTEFACKTLYQMHDSNQPEKMPLRCYIVIISWLITIIPKILIVVWKI